MSKIYSSDRHCHKTSRSLDRVLTFGACVVLVGFSNGHANRMPMAVITAF